MWTLPQRAVLLGVVAILVIALSIQLAWHRMYLSDPLPSEGSRAHELVDRLDPNTAPRNRLSALPGVGESLAAAIVDYREQFHLKSPGRLPFQRIDDLQHVRGIGPARAETLEPYLLFPSATTQTSR